MISIIVHSQKYWYAHLVFYRQEFGKVQEFPLIYLALQGEE